MNKFPPNTSAAVKINTLTRHEKPISVHKYMSSRMVQSACVLDREGFLGWEVAVPAKGPVQMYLFGTKDLCCSDLEWMAEHRAAAKETPPDGKLLKFPDFPALYEVFLPSDSDRKPIEIGFGAALAEQGEIHEGFKWPVRYSPLFGELIKAFQNTGAVFRAVLGSASEQEQGRCRKGLLKNWNTHDVDPLDYIGHPVRAKFLLRLPSAPSVRLMAVFAQAAPGTRLQRLGTMDEPSCIDTWENPLDSAAVLPDYAARILLLEPDVQESAAGIELSEEKAAPIPAGRWNTKSKRAVMVGTAMTKAGTRRRITIGELDLKRHYQIIGQTGTGKSMLLASMILSAVRQGYGLTFFDPHGSTVDMILHTVPAKYADRVRVVRLGDAENPVPLSIWDSDDPKKEERTISDLCELFSDIFDPCREGFVGPRYERWLSTFAKAAVAFLGRRASFESIAVISQSRYNMKQIAEAIQEDYPDLAETIRQEYIMDKGSEFQNTLNWYLCKFQRLTSVEQLRYTFGAGTNALDFNHSVDTDTVTLIDLASPAMGTNAARIAGTMILMKLWNAVMTRRERERTHIVFIDEAALFQTNPMPRMLAESRKFGLSMVLSHQHTGQLTWEVADALEANSANFSAFRLSPKDAASAAVRFNDPSIKSSLARLDAFRAVTTLSVDGQQTAPFTLEIKRLAPQKNGEATAAEIEQNSIRQLVEPYRNKRALTPAEIKDYLDYPEMLNLKTEEYEEQDADAPYWLHLWKNYLNQSPQCEDF